MAEWELSLSTNNISANADLDNLKIDTPTPFPNYALCLPRYSKLDGRFVNVKDIEKGKLGYVSSTISDSNGSFKEPPSIIIEFARKKTSNGIQFIFNELSNDYCSDLNIQWFKYDEVIYEQNFTPTASNYYCKAKVSLFDKIKITFKKTNKPFRYLFIAQMMNTRLTQGEGLKLIYNDIAYLGKEHTQVYSDDKREESNLNLLLQENYSSFPQWATLLPRYSKLDGTFINASRNIDDIPFVSKQISNERGEFEHPPSITFNVSEVIKSVGIQLYQNNLSNDYCNLVHISWYLNSAIVKEGDFEPTGTDFLCQADVDSYNKVVITFKRTNKPFRPAMLAGFNHGVIRVFDKREIKSCKVFDEIAPIGDSLPISTMQFNIRNNGIGFSIEKSQKMYVYFDSQIIGDFYLKSAERKSETDWFFKAENIISLLDSDEHQGGFYDAKNAKDLINEIFLGIDTKVVIDDSVEGLTVSGWLPYDTKRKNLSQICFALGLVVETAFETGVYIYKPKTDLKPTQITKKFIYDDAVKIKTSEYVTGVKVSVHSWMKDEEEKEPHELFKQSTNQQILIKFKEPKHSFEIKNGVIIKSHCNFALIQGNGREMVLTGKGYKHIEEIIVKENPNVYRNKKFASSKSATLVTNSNAEEVIERMYNYHCINNQLIKADIILNDVQLADIVQIETFDGVKKGIMKSISMDFYGEIRAEVDIKCLK